MAATRLHFFIRKKLVNLPSRDVTQLMNKIERIEQIMFENIEKFINQ